MIEYDICIVLSSKTLLKYIQAKHEHFKGGQPNEYPDRLVFLEREYLGNRGAYRPEDPWRVVPDRKRGLLQHGLQHLRVQGGQGGSGQAAEACHPGTAAGHCRVRYGDHRLSDLVVHHARAGQDLSGALARLAGQASVCVRQFLYQRQAAVCERPGRGGRMCEGRGCASRFV